MVQGCRLANKLLCWSYSFNRSADQSISALQWPQCSNKIILCIVTLYLFVQYFTLHKDLFIVCSLLLYNSSDACHYNAGHAKCSDHGDMLVITMFTSFTTVYTFDLIRTTTVTRVTWVTEFIQLKKQLWWPHGSTRANETPEWLKWDSPYLRLRLIEVTILPMGTIDTGLKIMIVPMILAEMAVQPWCCNRNFAL